MATKTEYKKRKKSRQEEFDNSYENYFKKHNRIKKKIRTPKKKSYDFFLSKVNSLTLHMIRDPKSWVAKSHNIDRQYHSFIRHCFCKYYVPRFMFSIFSTDEKAVLNFNFLVDWFIAIGQGKSFRKISNSVFNKKEAHLFLNSPYDNIISNIVWVKCKSNGLNKKLTNYISTIGAFKNNFLAPSVHTMVYGSLYHHKPEDPNYFLIKVLLLSDIIEFFSKYQHQLNENTVNDIMDFLLHYENGSFTINNFSFKGRTLNSVIRLSNEWHYEIINTNTCKNISWDSLEIEEVFYKNKETNIEYHIKELTSSKELLHEGRVMRNCVSSYSIRCTNGNTNIFSLYSKDIYGNEKKEATIEVANKKRIVQTRAKANKDLNKTQKSVVRKWAIKNNLNIY